MAQTAAGQGGAWARSRHAAALKDHQGKGAALTCFIGLSRARNADRAVAAAAAASTTAAAAASTAAPAAASTPYAPTLNPNYPSSPSNAPFYIPPTSHTRHPYYP